MRRSTALLAGILAFAAAIRLVFLTRNGVWFDEALVLHYVEQPFRGMLAMVRAGELQPPAFHILLYGYTKLLGSHPQWVAEIPSAVIGLLGIYFAYLVGREMFDRETGLAASALLAVSTYYLKYSWEIRPYALLATLCLASTYYMVRFLEEPGRRRHLVFFFLASAVAVNTHYFALLTLAVQNLYVFGFHRRRVILWPWVRGQALVGLALLPWFLVFLDQMSDLARGEYMGLELWIPPLTFPLFLGQFFPLVSFNFQRYFAGALEGGGAVIDWRAVTAPAWLVLLAFGGLTVLAAIRLRKRAGRPETIFWFLYLFVPVGLAAAFSLSVQSVFQERYLAGAMPGFLFLAAVGLGVLRPVGRRILLAGLLALGVADTAEMIRVPHDPAPRRIAEFIDEEGGAGDRFVFLNCYYYFPVLYYDRGRHDLRLFVAEGGRRALELEVDPRLRFSETTAPMAKADARRLFFVDDGYYFNRAYEERVRGRWVSCFGLPPEELRMVRRAGPIGAVHLWQPGHRSD